MINSICNIPELFRLARQCCEENGMFVKIDDNLLVGEDLDNENIII